MASAKRPAAKVRSRPTGKKTARRTRVAKAIVSGKSVTQIAGEEGVSRATASADANSPEVQLLITSLVEAEREKIRTLWQKALGSIEESFSAERKAVFEGDVVPLGPDHYARLTGVKCLTQLLTAGRQAVKPEPPVRRMLTLDELKQLASEGVRVN
jgi:hypothetical protein